MKEKFAIAKDELETIAVNFSKAMAEGLKGETSPLKMLPSFLKNPTGREKGDFLAIDFGGSNVRVLRIRLNGQREFEILNRRDFALKHPQGIYDYTSSKTAAAELFDFIALKIKEISQDIPVEPIFLGHTFSFACRQKNLTEATLIKWAKELKTSGAEGRDVGKLLKDALVRAGLEKIHQAAIINDTVATLLTAAYLRPGADIASICGTGHNTCYIEPNHPQTNQPMIINMESGNFTQIPQTTYDLELDRNSEKPGLQLLEKQCSGNYLGEILRLALNGHLGDICEPYCLKGQDLALLVGKDAPAGENIDILTSKLGVANMQPQNLEFIRETATLIVKRSARLVAATFFGTLKFIDPDLTRPHIIAIDGSLYEKMPGYSLYIKEALDELLKEKNGRQITIELVKDGSAIGAAIAAAIATESINK